MPITLDSFHDAATGTVTHLLHDDATRQAAVIDPVLDFCGRSSRSSTTSATRVLDALRARGGTLAWILETHVHADHLSAARWLQRETGGGARIAIGAHVRSVADRFSGLLGASTGGSTGGSTCGSSAGSTGAIATFDRLLEDGDTLALGESTITALWVPGHTPANLAYLVDDRLFVGDTLFMPDVGTARADFPGGDARRLYRSIRSLLSLPGETRMYVCHDYPPAGRGVQWETTVADQRARNVHVRDGIDEDAFVAMRETRDATLDVPALMLPALQVNLRAGDWPAPEADGVRYLRLPVDAFPTGGR